MALFSKGNRLNADIQPTSFIHRQITAHRASIKHKLHCQQTFMYCLVYIKFLFLEQNSVICVKENLKYLTNA